MQGFRLPSYEMPQNALLNLQPINAAITDYRAREQQGIENERQNKLMQFREQEMGLQRERFGMEKEKFGEDKAQRVRERAGNLALLTLQDSDPARRAQRWQQFVATNPNAAGLDPKYHDPNTGPLAVLADAGMAQQYLEHQLRRSTEARANEQLSMARQTHTAQMSQYQNMTPAQRQQAAGTLGLEAGSPAYNTFVSSGQYTPPGDPLRTVKEGETLLRAPTQPGKPPEIVWAGSDKNKANDKFNEAAATTQVQRYNDTITQGANQSAALGTITTLRGLSDKIGAPGVGNTIARTLGPSLRNVGIEVGNLSDMEAFNAIISRLVPAQRPPGSGTMSDKDVELFKASLPQLAATAQGRKLILDQIEAIANYDKQRAVIASKAINGEIPRNQAEVMLREMPDPMELFRSQTGQRQQGAAGTQGPPQGAVDMLRNNPSLAAAFDEKYGAGSAASVLGRR